MLMKIIEGSLEKIPGYSFSSIMCGIRYENRYDYSLIVADSPCHASGVFTTNKVCAAPVKVSRNRIGSPVRGILINATNANACTGDQGFEAVLSLTGDIAVKLHAPADSILMASTGIIGQQLPLEKMLSSHEALVGSLNQGNGSLIPKAIMTTDTVPKSITVSFTTSRGEFMVGGAAKGVGMIAPNMATMLAFILTDCPLNKKKMDVIFKRIINKTLNAITIDGDMSTNDTALLLSPISKKPIRDKNDLAAFEEALEYVLLKLAEMLVSDGEGATKFIRILVKGAKTSVDAKKIGKSVAESLLVKTAFFGNDPNWGRIACAAGYSGATIIEEKLSIYYDHIPLLLNGVPQVIPPEDLKKVLDKRELLVTLHIQAGKHDYTIITSDISYEYVKINGSYST